MQRGTAHQPSTHANCSHAPVCEALLWVTPAHGTSLLRKPYSAPMRTHQEPDKPAMVAFLQGKAPRPPRQALAVIIIPR